MKLNILNLGTLDYKETLAIQYDLLKKVQEGQCHDTLILVEHPPVITLGRNAKFSNVLINEDLLKEKEIDLYQIKRGGDVTYHGTGQLVGYPIFNLKKNHGRSIKIFIEKLETLFIHLINDEFDISVGRHVCNNGVWYQEEKVLALGLSVQKGVTMHGFALNLNTNLDHFKYIIPCGLKDMGVTSIEKISGKKVDVEAIKEKISHYFVATYGYQSMESIEKW